MNTGYILLLLLVSDTNAFKLFFYDGDENQGILDTFNTFVRGITPEQPTLPAALPTQSLPTQSLPTQSLPKQMMLNGPYTSADTYDFMFNYPCDEDIRIEFRRFVSTLVGTTKDDAWNRARVNPTIKSAIDTIALNQLTYNKKCVPYAVFASGGYQNTFGGQVACNVVEQSTCYTIAKNSYDEQQHDGVVIVHVGSHANGNGRVESYTTVVAIDVVT
jgi:hypothetical protein